MSDVEFSEMLGQTLARVDGAEYGSEEIRFVALDGKTYLQFHEQDCCETVTVEDVTGDLEDVIGSPLVEAEEVSQPAELDDGSVIGTWTFYKLRTEKGSLVIRWLGESNGYYSERVSFKRLDTRGDKYGR